MIKKTFYIFVVLSAVFFIHVNAAKMTNSGNSSGGKTRSKGPVRFVSIGEPVVGRGRGALVGLGSAYIGGKTKGAGSLAPLAPAVVKPATAGISSEFRLGEVYVYPNPAKGGKIPVFHIEVGIADSVKLTVYSVAGRVVHEQTLTGIPQVISKDGNSFYAYEYPWSGHITSGVYYYLMKAERAGKHLKKSGKFAVIR